MNLMKSPKRMKNSVIKQKEWRRETRKHRFITIYRRDIMLLFSVGDIYHHPYNLIAGILFFIRYGYSDTFFSRDICRLLYTLIRAPLYLSAMGITTTDICFFYLVVAEETVGGLVKTNHPYPPYSKNLSIPCNSLYLYICICIYVYKR
jgi:hypothetical protein